MKKILLFVLMGCFTLTTAHAQNETQPKENLDQLIERITQATSHFKIDTTAVPDDRITRKIEEIRKYRGNFNIDALIDLKLMQDKNSHKHSKAELTRETNFFKTGDGSRWIHNAVVWVYRKHFTYKELKGMARFYKSPAGQKWGSDFPIVLVQVGMVAEQVGQLYQK